MRTNDTEMFRILDVYDMPASGFQPPYVVGFVDLPECVGPGGFEPNGEGVYDERIEVRILDKERGERS